MSLESWMLYAGTVLVLMSIPGPSQLLILSNSLSSGPLRSMLTAAGDLTANFLQMSLATAGVAYLIASNAGVVVIVKWLGVGYLVVAGIISLRNARAARQIQARTRNVRSAGSLYFQGFLVSAVNPKAVIFFAALFPQFIDLDDPVVAQFFILSITYLVMDGLFLVFYALLASLISNWLVSHDGVIMRFSPGIILVLVALGLSLKSL